MESWSKVRWTEATQVTEQLGWDEGASAHGQPPVAPQVYFANLRREGRLREAVQFLGQALPRYETVAWATRVVRDLEPAEAAADEALSAALAWVADPSETARRAAFEAAQRARSDSPSRLAAMAVFFSGGSMSPEGQPAVPAPREAAGRFGAGAVLAAAVKSGQMNAALTRALDQGEAIAAKGLPPSPRPER